MNQWLTPIAIAGITTILVNLVSTILSAKLQNKQITVSDSASFRQSLVDRETTLVGEIQCLSDKCRELEKDLHDANCKIVMLEKAKSELEIDLLHLKATINEKTDIQ
jgi:hypothetical protein